MEGAVKSIFKEQRTVTIKVEVIEIDGKFWVLLDRHRKFEYHYRTLAIRKAKQLLFLGQDPTASVYQPKKKVKG